MQNTVSTNSLANYKKAGLRLIKIYVDYTHLKSQNLSQEVYNNTQFLFNNTIIILKNLLIVKKPSKELIVSKCYNALIDPLLINTGVPFDFVVIPMFENVDDSSIAVSSICLNDKISGKPLAGFIN